MNASSIGDFVSVSAKATALKPSLFNNIVQTIPVPENFLICTFFAQQ